MSSEAERSIRRALALLEAASADCRRKGPSDGREPLHWPLAVRAARAHLTHALTALEPAAAREPRVATPDDLRGMAWFNGLTEAERLQWLKRADSACPADAWGGLQGRGGRRGSPSC